MVSASDALVPRRHHSMTTLLARHRSTCPSGDVIPATHTQVVTSSTGGQRPQQTTGNGTCLKKSLAGTIDNDRSHRATNCLTTPTTPLVQTSVIDVVGKPVGKPIERATQTRSVYLIFHFICRSFLSLWPRQLLSVDCGAVRCGAGAYSPTRVYCNAKTSRGQHELARETCVDAYSEFGAQVQILYEMDDKMMESL